MDAKNKNWEMSSPELPSNNDVDILCEIALGVPFLHMMFRRQQPSHIFKRTLSIIHGGGSNKPQHPTAHGVSRLVLKMNGEVVERAEPHIGLLQCGMKPLMPSRLIKRFPKYILTPSSMYE
ncbi:hypothetical protein RND71_029504 [Anisodus tanguticus]|uniref:Uncharacterized protein n=1 Tax=Anisodus tanguticus TaxID=243964 RepID=A0AAE1RE57_9SOLA|nr:hypothetical protein RND71_029504 [Anisodus tanguticus]